MKTKLLTLLSFSLFIVAGLQAKILTVNNNIAVIAMYKSAQAAVDAAAVGDTVFAQASTLSYGALSITKQITLMGEGFKGLDNKLGTYTSFNSINIDSTTNGDKVSGGQFVGFRCHAIVFPLNKIIKGYVIRNILAGEGVSYFYGTGHVIINCLFVHHLIYLGSNCLFANNVTQNGIREGNTCIVNNNIFVTGNIAGMNSSSISNNIFLHAAAAIGATNTRLAFSKNMQGGTDLPAGNFTNVASFQIFSETSVNSTMASAIVSPRYFQKTTSPAKNAGTDGKDLGVYGGQYPWPTNKIFNGDPGLPQVTNIEVENAVLAPGGTLKFNFKAKSFSKR